MPSRTDNSSCLTEKQVSAVEKIWSGVKTSDGDLIYPGLVPGGEADPGGWGRWVTGAEPFTSLHWLGGEGFFRWFVFDDPDWDFTSFDFDKDLEYALQKVGNSVDSNNPDLRRLRDNGSKLIVYHGWSDPDISPVASINYYESVVDTIADDMRLQAIRPRSIGHKTSFVYSWSLEWVTALADQVQIDLMRSLRLRTG